MRDAAGRLFFNTDTWLGAELEWLQNDLAANHAACTLAYWHQPTYSAANSLTTEGTTAQAFWQLLYEHGADLVLNGHDHLYARYRPLDPSGNYDPQRGIREFIVGTGGETLDTIVTTGTSSNPGGDNNFNTNNLEAATGNFWGVMGLTLDPRRLPVGFRVGPGTSWSSCGDVQRQGRRHVPRGRTAGAATSWTARPSRTTARTSGTRTLS